MDIPVLTMEMITVFSVLGMVIVLLVFDLLRVDVVGLLVMATLPVTGLLTGTEAVDGLGSNAVVVLICVMVLGASLNKTGLVSKIARKIVSLAGNSETRVTSLLGLTAAIPSGIMSNVGTVALMLPAALKVSRQSLIPASKIIMPMGFCANMGGNLALTGSTPLIILNDVMAEWWLSNSQLVEGNFIPLGLFSITPIGVALIAGTMLYFLLIGNRLLPVREGIDEGGVVSAKLRELYGDEVGKGVECVIPDNFAKKTIGQLELRSRYKVSAIAVANDEGRNKILAPLGTTSIGPGDIVVLACCPDSLKRIIEELGWQPRENYETFTAELAPEKNGVVEAIISSNSALN